MNGVRENKTLPKEGSAVVDCVCDADKAAVVGDFKDSEKELVFPEDDAGVLVVLKPVKPEVGADALVNNGVDPVEDVPLDAGKVKPELALVPAEDTLAATRAESLVVVVVVTVENRAEGVVPKATGFEAGALERDEVKADEGNPVVPNEKPDEDDEETVADAEEAGLLVLFRNEKPEEVEIGAVENAGTDEADDAGNESPGAEEVEVEALGKENPGAEATELEVLMGKGNAEVELEELGNENPGAEEAELEEWVDGVPLSGEADDDPINEEDPKRPRVDPELGPNKDDEVPPVVVGDEDVEDPNMPAGAEPDPNSGAVAAAVGADVDDPN